MKNDNLEIELKFQLDVPVNFFRKKIVSNWKKIQPRTHETTSMYDNKEKLMLTSDGRLRIRTGHNNSISYKRPLTRDGIKIEIEHESEIKNPEQVELILKKIGYEVVSSYERFRTIWKAGKTEIYLDEFSFGNYVEIEGKKDDILAVAKELGFDIKKNITASYDGIYKRICKKKGINPSNHIK